MSNEKKSTCPECLGDDLDVVTVRDVERPRRKKEPTDAEPVVVARKLELQCRHCGWSGFVVQPTQS